MFWTCCLADNCLIYGLPPLPLLTACPLEYANKRDDAHNKVGARKTTWGADNGAALMTVPTSMTMEETST